MSDEKVIGVPEKGRNAGIALRQEEVENAEFIIDVLNGAGKRYAKRATDRFWIEKTVKDLECVELKDTGRPFRRPVFTKTWNDGELLTSYEDPLEDDLDTFYQGLDRFVEQQGLELSRDMSLYEEVAEEAENTGYSVDGLYGEPVSWSAMNTDLGTEPETVLLPDEFPELGRAVAEEYWDSEPDYSLFSEFGDDEEEVLADTADEVAGVYMVVSGGTADNYGLEYDTVPGFGSRLARFERNPENRFKNSEGNTE